MDQSTNPDRMFLFLWLRRLYDWVLSLGQSPYGAWSLFLLAVAESSFFPIPPDVLLIALALGAPRRAFWFSAICSFGSILGGILGYLIGLQFYELVGQPIIEWYSVQELYEKAQALYQKWDALALAIAGFTPIPYKVFTIAAGAFKVNFATFVLVSIFSRGARFFLLGGLIWWCGPAVQKFIDRYFNLLTVIFVILLLGGFVLLRYIIY